MHARAGAYEDQFGVSFNLEFYIKKETNSDLLVTFKTIPINNIYYIYVEPYISKKNLYKDVDIILIILPSQVIIFNSYKLALE